MPASTAWVEVVTDGAPDMVWASRLEQVPVADLEAAKTVYAETKQCTCHTVRRFIEDTPGYPVDCRSCAVCGRYLGCV